MPQLEIMACLIVFLNDYAREPAPVGCAEEKTEHDSQSNKMYPTVLQLAILIQLVLADAQLP